MIVEQRTYDLYPGKVAEFTRLIETEGIAIQRPILGRLIGYYASDIGSLNQIVHLWGYESLEDRAVRRARLLADPRWLAFAAKTQPLLMRMENKILLPMSFSPMPELWQEGDERSRRIDTN
jgi:hypothetical protein